MNAKKIILFPLATALTALASTSAHAMPASASVDPLPAYVSNALPAQSIGYQLLRDNEQNIVYMSPRYGVLATQFGMPMLSFAEVNRGENRYAVLNASFNFAVDRDDFLATKKAVQSVGWSLQPLPFESTTATLSINDYDDGEAGGLCGEVEDILTGEPKTVCANFVIRARTNRKGPTLGEYHNTQLVLTGEGADLYQKLLKGGNGISLNMEGQYRAAFPAYTATLKVNFRKLQESFASYFSNKKCFFHTEVSRYFKRESICKKNASGKFLSLNGSECAIRVSYVNQRGEHKNNMFQLPDNPSDADMAAFTAKYNNQIKIVHDAITGMQKIFESRMLEKIPTATVSKKIKYGYIYRAESRFNEDEVNVSLQRKTIGQSALHSTTIPGLAVCVETDPNTGDVNRYTSRRDCRGFWERKVAPLDFLDQPGDLGGDDSDSGSGSGSNSSDDGGDWWS